MSFKCPGGDSVLSETGGRAGTLEGFHLMGNVKHSVKQFNETKDRKEPDLSPPGKANTAEAAAAPRRPAPRLLC